MSIADAGSLTIVERVRPGTAAARSKIDNADFAPTWRILMQSVHHWRAYSSRIVAWRPRSDPKVVKSQKAKYGGSLSQSFSTFLIRSGACTCSMIPLAADSDPRDETILQRRLFEAMSFVGSSTEDLPGLIGPGDCYDRLASTLMVSSGELLL